jgi:hypothetical protein
MINEVNKLVEPLVNSEGKVTSWTFGLECECSESGVSGYAESSVNVDTPKAASDWTKAEIDNLYAAEGLGDKVSNQIASKKSKAIASQSFDYSTL